MQAKTDKVPLRVAMKDQDQGDLARLLFDVAAGQYIAMETPDAVGSQLCNDTALFTSLPGEPVTAGFLVDYRGGLLRVTVSREPGDA